MTPNTMTTLDMDALRQAWEAKDVAAILDFYADDAEIRYVDEQSRPTSPKVLDKDAFAAVLRDVAGRDLTTRVERSLAAGDGAALSMHCRYDDGTEVIANQVLDVRDGRIARHLEVTAWDEPGSGSGAEVPDAK